MTQATVTDSRLDEMLDFATVYCAWDENTPVGETHDLCGEPMSDTRRDLILVLKELRRRRDRQRRQVEQRRRVPDHED